jgi:FAD:protein FMN transferase
MPYSELPAAPRSVCRLRVALGTLVAVEAEAGTESAASAALESAFHAVAEVDAAMHPTRAGSSVARVNRARPGTRIEIDPATHQLLQLSRRLHQLSDGVFDPCVPELPGGFDDLELSAAADEPWVRCRVPLALDLGGIAKGHAVDRAVEALRQAGAHAGLVNAGGDLRVFGGDCQTVFVRRAGHGARPMALHDTALAVSDLEARERPPEHRGYYVRKAQAVTPRGYAAVLAPSAAVADALTKCLLLCRQATARAALAAFGARSVS